MSNRTEQALNSDHVAFLQQKKAEILAKKQQERDGGTAPPTPSMAPQPKVTQPTVKKSPNVNLMFANDGSFMERFKAMQQQKQLSSIKVKNENEYSNPPQPPEPPEPPEPQPPEPKLPVLPPPRPPPLPPQIKPSHMLPGVASIFQEDEEVEGYLPTDYDLAKDLATRVAEDGPHAEEEAREKYLGDSRYKFLTDPSSPVALYYQSELRASRKRRRDGEDGEGGEGSSSSTSTSSSSGTYGSQNNRSSGSSSSNATVVDPKAEFEKAKALFAAKAAAVKGAGAVSSPAPVVTEEELKKQKAIEEQKMMNELYRKVIEQQAYMAAQRVAANEDKPRYEYDSDEDTEGGTWEHKKRKKEMKKTEEWAGDLTERGRGKHHLSDFLPPEELEKFMENVKAVQEGRQADISDYAKFKIQADNVGFQLLQKAGWEEGSGLGKRGDGIQQPVNKGKTAFEQAGVGAEKPMEVKKDDDDFELYRKRMMLAYKFRPNPLNNPRRPYYE